MEPQALEGATSLEMDLHPALTDEEPSTSALWDWSDLLDFTTDDHFNIPLVSDLVQANPDLEAPQKQPAAGKPGRVRKRDPRMTCSNFLAGRIPCACPEIDEKLEEEEANMPGKKRPRTGRVGSGRTKCQIPGCKADISELKGYHIRHRVCLRCATASSVLLDGTKKRYCQQCGKFHVLSDFDEGKRSCRWKLERHNEIRRKKSADSKSAPDNEPPGALQSEDLAYDGEVGKDGLCVSSQLTDQEAFFESEDGQGSTLRSAPNSQNVNSDSGLSFAASGEIRMDGGKDDANIVRSPSNCDNKSTFSSLCPTGRISFKLYDWNPAEFPRRLRHQIFEWLASMPVELEGYIRPGCTILTVFIAMPRSMWAKLYEDPVMYVHDFVVTPGRMLSGRGSLFVYLNNIVFHVKDGTSIAKVKGKVQAPRLHFVHPTCFEAGKPMEFVACGSNLMQPRFRFLISFAGKYLPYECRIATPCGQSEGDPLTFDHQLYKIYVPQTEQNLFGPAFVEVENESGLSNFIPVLIGDKEICHEMKMLLHRFEAPLVPEVSQFLASGSPSDLCESSVQRQTVLIEFLSDIAWLLKVPTLESFQQTMSSSQVQRFNSLFSFLLYHESTTILGKMLQTLNILMDNMGLSRAVTFDTDMGLLLKNMDRASDLVHKKLPKIGCLMPESWNIVPKRSSRSQSCSDGNLLVSISNQDLETRQNGEVGLTVVSDATDRSETVPLVSKEVVMNVTGVKGLPNKSCGHNFSGTALSSRPTVFIIAITAVCFGICVVLVHPKKVGEFAVSIRRSLFGKF